MKMKKVITFASFALIMGLGFVGYENTPVDTLLGTEDKGEKTYLVRVDGNVTGTEEEKEVADKNRKQVLSELALKLGEDSYEVTYVYDTIYNGFAIKTTADKAEILKNTAHVAHIGESHVYAAPTGDEQAIDLGSSSSSGTSSIKSQKLANYSSETMQSTKADIEAVVGEGNYNGGEGITIGILDTGLYMNQVEGTQARKDLENNATLKDKINAPAFVDLAEGVETTFTKDSLYDTAGKCTATGKNATYINKKIPYCYDYVGNDNDVDPTTNGSNHGTHVASLAGANGKDFQGIAPNAQICVLKVFGDGSGGASQTDVIAALQDAVKLGLDEINMSLGSDLYDNGYDNDGIDNESYLALKACSDAGIVCNISAGNSGKSSFSSGNYGDYTTDTVEGGILGSYANYDEAANIVASSNPNKAFYSSIMQVQKNGSETASSVSYSDQVKNSTTQTFTKERPLTDLIGYSSVDVTKEQFDSNPANYYTARKDSDGNPVEGVYDQCAADAVYSTSEKYYQKDSSVTKEYVVVPGYGEADDYATLKSKDIDIKGKIAVVHRGNTTFVQKYQLAQNNGAIALIVINNNPSTTFNFTMAFSDNSPDIPVVFVFQNSTSAWGDACSTGNMTLRVNEVAEAGDGNTVSSFSSDGPSSNLDIGPTISAPGYQVIGAVSASASNSTSASGTSDVYGYENMSGTSMASPNLTGALAVALSQKKAEIEDDTSLTDEQKKAEFKSVKQIISKKAMSTADQLIDGTKSSENSPRMQGSGRINVASLLQADSYVDVENTETDGFSNTTQSKAELKNSGSLYVADGDFSKTTEAAYIEFNYTIHNDSDKAKTYTPSISVMIPKLEISTTHASYAAEQADSRSEEVGYDGSVTFNADDESTYPTYVGTPTMTVNDDTVLSYEDSKSKFGASSSISVAANSTATGTVKIRIDDLHFEKDWNDGNYIQNFSGTLKEYIEKYFSGSAGTYVEGYLKLEENSDTSDLETLTVPYLGFYGDYSSADAVEPFDFEKEDKTANGKYNSNYHIYNSDLADNYLQHLSDAYKKPKAYTGSALSASSASLTSTQINNICTFAASPVANGSDLYSVVDSDKTQLYAGSKNSQHLNAFFYVNRSCSDANWYIKDANGSTVSTGKVKTLLEGSSNSYTAVDPSQYGLVKSWLTASETGYSMCRGYADINVSSVKEGTYTLEFAFTLKGAKDTNGNAKVQTRSYKLNIDKTAPSITSITTQTVGTGTRLVVTAKGANDVIRIGSSNQLPTLVEGTTDTYTASARLTNSVLEKDKVCVTLSDYAHNSTVAIVHPSNLTFSVSSTFFTDKYDFTVEELDSDAHLYTITILDKNGNATTANEFTLMIQLDTNLSKDDIVLELDGSETSNFTYDSATGILTVKIPKDVTTFQINQQPGGSSVTPTPDPTPDSSSSSTVIDSSSSAPSDNTSTGTEEKKGGCGGSVAIASSTIAALGLAGLGLVLKKKKEDK
jgi:hypothetical protein